MERLVTSRLIRIYTVCHSIIAFPLNIYLQQRMYSNSEMEESMLETQGWKGQSFSFQLQKHLAQV